MPSRRQHTMLIGGMGDGRTLIGRDPIFLIGGNKHPPSSFFPLENILRPISGRPMRRGRDDDHRCGETMPARPANRGEVIVEIPYSRYRCALFITILSFPTTPMDEDDEGKVPSDHVISRCHVNHKSRERFLMHATPVASSYDMIDGWAMTGKPGKWHPRRVDRMLIPIDIRDVIRTASRTRPDNMSPPKVMIGRPEERLDVPFSPIHNAPSAATQSPTRGGGERERERERETF